MQETQEKLSLNVAPVNGFSLSEMQETREKLSLNVSPVNGFSLLKMQETQEKLSLNVAPFNGFFSQNPTMPLGLVCPYQKQSHDMKYMAQNQMIRDLYSQLLNQEERSAFFMNIKEKAIEELNIKSVKMGIQLRKALAEVEYWKKMADQRTNLCRDLAGRLLKVKKREMAKKVNAETNVADEAESSTGDNGDDVLDTAMTRLRKRRRVEKFGI